MRVTSARPVFDTSHSTTGRAEAMSAMPPRMASASAPSTSILSTRGGRRVAAAQSSAIATTLWTASVPPVWLCPYPVRWLEARERRARWNERIALSCATAAGITSTGADRESCSDADSRSSCTSHGSGSNA